MRLLGTRRLIHPTLSGRLGVAWIKPRSGESTGTAPAVFAGRPFAGSWPHGGDGWFSHLPCGNPPTARRRFTVWCIQTFGAIRCAIAPYGCFRWGECLLGSLRSLCKKPRIFFPLLKTPFSRRMHPAHPRRPASLAHAAHSHDGRIPPNYWVASFYTVSCAHSSLPSDGNLQICRSRPAAIARSKHPAQYAALSRLRLSTRGTRAAAHPRPASHRRRRIPMPVV